MKKESAFTASVMKRRSLKACAAFVLAVTFLTCPANWMNRTLAQADDVLAQAAGDLDPTFGTAGRVTTDFFGGADQASAVAIQPDGKIVAAGFAEHPGSAVDFAIARYNADGSLDSSFGVGGKVTILFPGYSQSRAFGGAIQFDGKLVVVGGASKSENDSDFAVARVDGQPRNCKADLLLESLHYERDVYVGQTIMVEGVIENNGPDVARPRLLIDPIRGVLQIIDPGIGFTDLRFEPENLEDLYLAPGQQGKFFSRLKTIATGELQLKYSAKSFSCDDPILQNNEALVTVVVHERPRIDVASISGKQLLLNGTFETLPGATGGPVIMVNGIDQKTAPDEQNPFTLIAKKAGKQIKPGQTVTLQVRMPDGTRSNEFPFTRPQ
ncbi:MAG TPA: delta-60 repeat domain-containing protein [Blastocatellia bacterium]|nr:delta-60 repeat domain-containing protein [Blastocatellia bacterium]